MEIMCLSTIYILVAFLAECNNSKIFTSILIAWCIKVYTFFFFKKKFLFLNSFFHDGLGFICCLSPFFFRFPHHKSNNNLKVIHDEHGNGNGCTPPPLPNFNLYRHQLYEFLHKYYSYPPQLQFQPEQTPLHIKFVHFIPHPLISYLYTSPFQPPKHPLTYTISLRETQHRSTIYENEVVHAGKEGEGEREGEMG